MIKVEGLWEDVQEGFYIQDKTGKWWLAMYYESGGIDGPTAGKTFLWLEDREGTERRITLPEGHRPVTMMYEPKKLIERKLGGREIQ